MKLALIRQRYNAFGGAERFIEQAMRAMASEGSTSVSLVTREWATGDESGRVLCNPFYLGRTWRDWGFARAACAATRQGFDLVQSHERIACCDVYRAGDGVHAQWLANRARALPLRARAATRLSPWHRYTLAAERRLFASARLKMVICNSRMVADEVRRHFGLADEKIQIIYNGVDSQRFHPDKRTPLRTTIRSRLGLAESAFVHLFVGSGFERKGVPQLLRAMRGLADDAHLIVVGEDRKLAKFRSHATRQGLSGRVHFTGPQPDIEAWYAAADCFVLPTLYDPFPNAALEAMASGLPVITSTQCGAAELIGPAQCGLSCDALDVDTLTRHMAGMTREHSATMGTRARAVAEKLTMENMVSQLTALYRELLSAP